ncbi:hypothetical protein Nham_2092 [Nitrobacter hamburgensis X14]|uniref:Uncharacterized protein n=1 Tax=Nitrobacter hamburgensis (strain DSM 10229 / NCIMB 13809 / X14) TaxID=323097 RepID=Q1QLK8_NITHX|nr:hypothetical protein Nham_2092 [Nitrobacter hamburgensis X14]
MWPPQFQEAQVFELKKFAMKVGIPESLFLRYCDVVGAKDRLSKDQLTRLGCLMFFPLANIPPEELLARLERCTVNMFYFPKTMSPNGGKWPFRGALAQYFVDDAWIKERHLAPQQAPLRRLNSEIFPGNDEKDELTLLIAIGEVLHNAHHLLGREADTPTLMASHIDYNPELDFGEISFLQSTYDQQRDVHEITRGEEGYPAVHYDLDFGSSVDEEAIISRTVSVPFTTLLRLNRSADKYLDYDKPQPR